MEIEVVRPTAMAHRDRPRPSDDRGTSPLALELAHRWTDLRAGAIAGAASVIAGGLVAAVARPLELDLGSWVAAFLVLVGGVAQIVVTASVVVLPSRPPSPRTRRVRLLLWNGAVAGTIVGTVAGLPILTTASTLVLAVALLDLWRALDEAPWRRRAVTRSVRALLAALVISLPVGLVLSWLRHG